MTSPYKQTQKQGSALTFGVLFQNLSIAKSGCHVRTAMPANRERPRRSFVRSGGCQACGGCIEMRDPGAVADLKRPLPHCSEDRANN
jgi:hypothetical protein